MADFRAELLAYRTRGRWSGDACRRLGRMWDALDVALYRAVYDPSKDPEVERVARRLMTPVRWRVEELLDGIFVVEDIDLILARLEPYAAVQADGQRGGAEGSTGGDWFGEKG